MTLELSTDNDIDIDALVATTPTTRIPSLPVPAKVFTKIPDIARAKTADDENQMRDLYNFEGLLDLYRLVQDASEAIGLYFYTDFSPAHANKDLLRKGMVDADRDGGSAYSSGSKSKGGGLGYRIRKTDDYVERTFDMSGVSPYYTGKELEEHAKEIEAVYKRFFPGVVINNRWTRSESMANGNGSMAGKETYSLNEIISLTANMNPDIRKYSGGVAKIKARKQLLRAWGNAIFFDLTLSSKVPLVNHPDYRNEVYSGEATSTINVNVQETVRIRFPMNAAEWMTSIEEPDDFSLFTFLNHLIPIEQRLLLNNLHYVIPDISTRRYNNHFLVPIDRNFDEKLTRKLRNNVYKSSSPEATARQLKDFRTTVGAVAPRMSSDGYTIRRDGRVVYTNYIADINAYREAEEDAYDRESGEFVLSSDALDKFRNKVLMVDWGGNVLVYTTDSGSIAMEDLKGAQAITDADIGDHLTHEFTPDTIVENPRGGFERDIHAYCTQLGVAYVSIPSRFIGIGLSFSHIDYHEMPEVELGRKGGPGKATDEDFEEFHKLLLRRGQMFKGLWSKFDEALMPISRRMLYRYRIQLAAEYALPENLRKYTKAWSDQVHKYNDSVEKPKNLTVYNYDKLKTLYPHQRRIENDFYARMPENVLLGAAPGGGKTNIGTIFSTQCIAKKVAKRPLIIMPGRLKSNFGGEIYRFSDHRIRVFPIYREMWDRWSGDLELGFAELQALIESLPVNTIFITDYSFLKLRPMTVRVGHKSVYTYPFAVFMSRLFDMFIGDESHKIKNLNAQLSEAFTTFSVYAKHKVLMSGTVVFNNADDTVGQMNIFSPNMFGSSIDNYQSSKGVISIDKMPAFHKRMGSFLKRYDANKREWSFLLPKVLQRLHKVDMPEPMREFYESSLAKVLDSIAAKAKAIAQREGLALDDPSLDERLSAIAQVELTPLEIFLCAPDDEDNRYSKVYSNHIAKGKLSLLKSPKVDMIDKLIDEHIRSGDNSKVLVLSYNLAISKHIAKHSKYASKMLRYTAATAAGEDTLRKFEDDKRIIVMTADENTLKEGFNLQFCGRVIRAQSPWTRGEFDQALSRVERPDEVMKDGSLRYNRKHIFLDWIVTSPSLEVAKAVRLFTKIIEAAKFDNYGQNKHFDDWISGKPVRGVSYGVGTSSIPALMEATQGRVTFSPDFVREYADFNKLHKHDELFQSFMKWTYAEFDATKEDLRKDIAAEKGVAPEKITDNMLRLLASKPVEHEELPESEDAAFGNGYMPFLPGVAPYDPWNLGLVEASRITSVGQNDYDDDDTDEEEVEEQVHLEKGMIVFTEYGLGEITPSGRLSARVDVSGKSVLVPKTSIWIPAQQRDRDRLRRIYVAMERKKLPTTTLSFKGSKLLVHDVYAEEKDIISGVALKPNPVVTSIDITGVARDTTEELNRDVPRPTAAAGGRSRTGSPAATGVNYTQPPKVATRTPLAPPKVKIPTLKPRAASATSAPRGAREVELIPHKADKVSIRIPSLRPSAHTTVKPDAKVPVKPAASNVQIPRTATKKTPKVSAEIHIAHINNLMCVAAVASEDGALLENGFHRIGASVSSEIKTWKGLDQMLTYLDHNFAVNANSMTMLEKNLAIFKRNEHNMDRVINNVSAQRDFMISQTRKAPAKSQNEIFPYLVVMEDVLHLVICSAVSNGSKKATMKLVGHRPVSSGAGKFERMDPFYVKFARNMTELDEILDVLDSHVRVRNFEDLRDEYLAQKKNKKFQH